MFTVLWFSSMSPVNILNFAMVKCCVHFMYQADKVLFNFVHKVLWFSKIIKDSWKWHQNWKIKSIKKVTSVSNNRQSTFQMFSHLELKGWVLEIPGIDYKVKLLLLIIKGTYTLYSAVKIVLLVNNNYCLFCYLSNV